ncbi:MAG: helix-turn-helix domain-containing protein [Gaiella sp.]|nr:helix-turn-helix domain-containing protein [Gaiella sp.]
MESMMTVRQVAELLGVHENWVYDHAASGDLPSYKIGGTRRFVREEIDLWVEQHRENGRGPKATRRRKRTERKPNRAKANRRPDEGQPRLFE